MLHRQSHPAAWALAGLSRPHLWWWRMARRGGRAARWSAAAGLLAVAAVIAFRSSPWSPQRTVSAFCFPYEATVPRSWKVVPAPPSPTTCGAGQGSLAFRAPSAEGDVVLVVQPEGPAQVSAFLGIFGYEHTSRSGVRYTMLAESNRNLTAAIFVDRQVYTIYCQSGAEASCRGAMTTLLDGSRFGGRSPR